MLNGRSIVAVCFFIILGAGGRTAVCEPLENLKLQQRDGDSTFVGINEDSLIAVATFTSDTLLRPSKSTAIAMLASIVIPGSGQIYNESYWKPPLIWGVGYYLLTVYLRQDDFYREHRLLYEESITVTDPQGNLTEKSLRDFYRGQRDTFGWYLAFAYVINILDAYVDASLFDFEVSPRLNPPNSEIRMTMRIKIY